MADLCLTHIVGRLAFCFGKWHHMVSGIVFHLLSTFTLQLLGEDPYSSIKLDTPENWEQFVKLLEGGYRLNQPPGSCNIL